MNLAQPATCCPPSDAVGRMRTRYFPGLLLGSDDLIQDQTYVLDKLRRHNRMLHGWGIVCGARVRNGREDCEVIVEPGYILGPYGDEIVIDTETSVDLCREGLDGNAVSPCGSALDPWCSDVRVDRRAGQTLYVAVKYEECQTRPVRGGAGACGCDLSDCEYSRIQDSFAIRALTRLPSTYDPMPPAELESAVTCGRRGEFSGRPCPPCPAEPWVILAGVRLTADGQVAEIDCFTHRRYVATFGAYYFLCDPRFGEVHPGDIKYPGVVTKLGQPVMVDLSADPDEPPAASVALRAADGSWMALPVHFSVEPGITWGELLEQERERPFLEPLSNERFTFGELAALAGVDADEVVDSLHDVLLPFEGLRLNVRDLRVVRGELVELLTSDAVERWERDHAGTIHTLIDLPATSIDGVGIRSMLAQRLADETIGSIASESRSEFVERMVEGVEGRQRTIMERQARAAWTAASRIARRSAAWQEDSPF